MRAGHPAAVGLILAVGLALGHALPAAASHGSAAPVVTGVAADSLKRQMDARQPPVLVDLRKRGEYQAGHLPGAVSLPLTELEKRYREIPPGQRVVLYCQCPAEDLVAAFLFLRSQGYTDLAVLEDGFDGWRQRDYPIAR